MLGLVAFIFMLNLNAQNSVFEHLKFEALVLQNDSMLVGENCNFVFNYTNVSEDIVQLKGVKCSSGNMMAKWSKEPILPGEKGSINVMINVRYAGPITKTVTVEFVDETAIVLLRLKGTVSEK